MSSEGPRVPALPDLLAGAAALTFLALAARLSVPVPGTDVPQSAQTFAVVVVGYLLGARGAAVTLLVYLLAGGLGLPVFADGTSGWGRVVGPTGGYLAGFVVAAFGLGWLADRGVRNPLRVSAAMVAGHVVILGLGWLWLARSMGAPEAWDGGVAPFLLGGVWKSAAGALVVWSWLRISDPEDRDHDDSSETNDP